MSNKIRLVDLPIYCSACFNQDPSARHVDFDAASDRGYGINATPIIMDDLILCEKCVQHAAKLVDYEDAGPLSAELVRLNEENQRLQIERDKAVGYADKMEDALHHRPEKIDGRSMKRPRELAA